SSVRFIQLTDITQLYRARVDLPAGGLGVGSSNLPAPINNINDLVSKIGPQKRRRGPPADRSRDAHADRSHHPRRPSGRLDLLRVACRKCERAGQYSVAKLIACHGPDAGLPDFKDNITTDLSSAIPAGVMELVRGLLPRPG